MWPLAAVLMVWFLTSPDFPFPLHGANCKDEGFVIHMNLCKGFSSQFCEPVTDVMVTRCDKSAPFSVKVMADREGGEYLGRSGRSKPYCRNRASGHSCAPSSVPFTVDGCTIINAPVFVAFRKWHVSWTGIPSRVYDRASYARRTLRLFTFSFHSWS